MLFGNDSRWNGEKLPQAPITLVPLSLVVNNKLCVALETEVHHL